jgi:hypothetical protein
MFLYTRIGQLNGFKHLAVRSALRRCVASCAVQRGTSGVFREKRNGCAAVTVEQYGTLIYIGGLIVFREYRGKRGNIGIFSRILLARAFHPVPVFLLFHR